MNAANNNAACSMGDAIFANKLLWPSPGEAPPCKKPGWNTEEWCQTRNWPDPEKQNPSHCCLIGINGGSVSAPKSQQRRFDESAGPLSMAANRPERIL